MLNHIKEVSSIAISPDNDLVASDSRNKTVRLWDVATQRLVKTLEGHDNSVSSAAFSADGKHIISASWDRTIRIRDARTGETVRQVLTEHWRAVESVAASPDGHWVASGSRFDGSVQIWSMSTPSEVHELEYRCYTDTCIPFSRDSAVLISGSMSGMVTVQSLRTGEALGVSLTGHTGILRSAAFSPNGHEFASGSLDGTVCICDMKIRMDFALCKESKKEYSELSEEELRIRWNVRTLLSEVKEERPLSPECPASRTMNGCWVRDGKRLLLWVPWQHRHDIGSCCGTRLVIGAGVKQNVKHRRIIRSYLGIAERGGSISSSVIKRRGKGTGV